MRNRLGLSAAFGLHCLPILCVSCVLRWRACLLACRRATPPRAPTFTLAARLNHEGPACSGRRPLHHGSPAPARLKLRSLMTRPAPTCLAHLIPKLTRGACPGRSERRQRGLWHRQRAWRSVAQRGAAWRVARGAARCAVQNGRQARAPTNTARENGWAPGVLL